MLLSRVTYVGGETFNLHHKRDKKHSSAVIRLPEDECN